MGHNDHCLYEHSKKKITWKVCEKCPQHSVCYFSVPDPDTDEEAKYERTIRYQYKCRRCGKIEQNTESSAKIGHKSLLGAIHNMKLTPDGIRVSLMETHLCKDNGMGVADLIGYEIIK